MALTSLSYANDFISNGQVKEYLSMVSVPKTVTITMVVLGLLGVIAKGRE